MDQVADEITLTADVTDKDAHTAEECSMWVRGGKWISWICGGKIQQQFLSNLECEDIVSVILSDHAIH